MIPFDTLKQFRNAKTRLAKLTGSDDEYYRLLLEAGYAKASHIPSQSECWPILAALKAAWREETYKFDEREAIREFGGG